MKRLLHLVSALRSGPVLALAAAVSSCAYLPRPAAVPMATELAGHACGSMQRPDTLVVLLPGVYSLPREFVREGFVRAVAGRRIAADVLLADAHRAYYDDGSIVERLEKDVIGPARSRGYRSIWLAGISLGGAGALGYSYARPGEITGIVALAPYTGPPITPAMVEAARPRLYLGFGESDRFAAELRVLAATMPPGRAFRVPGGHDWDAWRPLWDRVLEALPIARCAR